MTLQVVSHPLQNTDNIRRGQDNQCSHRPPRVLPRIRPILGQQETEPPLPYEMFELRLIQVSTTESGIKDNEVDERVWDGVFVFVLFLLA